MRLRGFCFLFVLLISMSFVFAGVVVDTAGEVRDIDLDLQREVVLTDFEKIIVEGKEYDAKPGSVFKFNSEGKLIEGTSFVANEGTFNINGFDVSLPEDSEVSFEDGKIVVKLPENSEISVTGDGEGLIEFISDGDINVLGMGVSGLIDDESLSVFFDGEFYITKAKINDFEVGRVEEGKVYLFSDAIPKDFEERAMLVQENKVVLRGGSEKDGLDVSYIKGGARMTMKALINGEIEIDFTEDEWEVVTHGDYKIYNGKLLEKNGLIGNLNKKYYDMWEVTDDAIPMHVVSYWDDGKMMPGETFHLDEGKYVLGYDKKDGIYTTNKGEIYIDDGETRVAFESLNGEQEEKYSGLGIQERIGVLREVAKGGNVASVFERISVSYYDKLEIKNWNLQKKSRSALGDIEDHHLDALSQTQDPRERDAFRIRKAGDNLGHERTHGLNSWIRNELAPQERVQISRNEYSTGISHNGFYLLNGEYVILREPKLDIIRDINPLLPNNLKTGGQYSFAESYSRIAFNTWREEPLYILDELTAYTNGGIVSLETNRDRSSKLPEFMSAATALGMAVESNGNSYSQSSDKQAFNNFLGYSLERSMDVHVRQTVRSGGTEQQAKQSFYGMTTPLQRQYLIDTFKESWTKRNLGF